MTTPSEASPAPSAHPSTSRRGRIVRRTLIGALIVVLGFFGVELLVNNFDEVLGAFDSISHPNLGWLALAILAELISYLTYAEALDRLLRSQRHRVGVGRLSLLSIAAQALGVCLPAGYAWSNVFSYRVLRGYDVDEVTAGRVLIVSVALYVAVLGLLAIVGAQAAGGQGPVHDVDLLAYWLLGVLAILFALFIFRPRQMRELTRRVLSTLERRLERRARVAAEIRRLRDELAHAGDFGRGTIILSAVWLLGAWIGDVACLVAAFWAIGAAPPWHGLLLAYSAAQLVALMPVTPGGLGVVEGSLTLALVSYGGGGEKTLAAVLLYRLISFWGLIPSGALCYGLLRTRRLRRLPGAMAEAMP